MTAICRVPAGDPEQISFDAVVLCGGKSSRLGGVPKSSLRIEGKTLLSLTCEAASEARRIVVVGLASGELPERAEVIRENPPYGGPAAAVSTAVAHLRGDSAPWLLVLACDMPAIAVALPVLLDRARATGTSVVAHDGGRDQPLAAMYRWADLDAIGDSEAVRNLSMRQLLARVQWSAVEVPAGSTNDVDTWSDAHRLGVEELNAGE